MSRNKHSNDSRRFHIWLDNAQEDIVAAQLLLQNPRCYKLASFHCQQALEKVLKSYILLKNNVLLDGHNLLWLCKQAAKADKNFLDFLDDCALINHFYIETRYPSDLLFEISEKQVKEIFISTKNIFDSICRKIYDEYSA